MTFIHDDFLLETDVARDLYHRAVAGLPIVDYHCHLPAWPSSARPTIRRLAGAPSRAGEAEGSRHARGPDVASRRGAGIEDPATFNAWLDRLGEAAGASISTMCHRERRWWLGGSRRATFQSVSYSSPSTSPAGALDALWEVDPSTPSQPPPPLRVTLTFLPRRLPGSRGGGGQTILSVLDDFRDKTDRIVCRPFARILLIEEETTMLFGLTLATYTKVHVIISLIGIAAGLIVACGLIAGKRVQRLDRALPRHDHRHERHRLRLPQHGFTPAQGVGYLSLAVLLIALIARYALHLAGASRWIYVVTAMIALYFNCFVLVVQSFQKINFLHTLAPHGNEPPFAIAQAVLLLLFITLTVMALKRFRGAAVAARRPASKPSMRG